MHRISVAERRARLGRRHRLAPGHQAASVADATASMVALHATDAATVYLSALCRVPGTQLADVGNALHDRGDLVRLLGIRRTVFVVPAATAPLVQAAASRDVAATSRRTLVKDLQAAELDPPVDGDVEVWLTEVEDATVAALEDLGRRRPPP